MVTDDDIQIVREYWFSISSNGLKITNDFYTQLFIDFPEYEQYFPKDKQALSEKLTRLLNIVVNGAEVIDHIEPMLIKLGHFHATIGDFSLQDYRNVSGTLIKVMEKYKGYEDKDAEQAWQIIFTEIATIMLNAPNIKKED